jgi:ankyrin repeat protein
MIKKTIMNFSIILCIFSSCSSPEKQLQLVLNNDDFKKTKVILDKYPRLAFSKLPDSEYYPIHRAAQYNNVKLMAYLISKGVSIYTMTAKRKYTPMRIAIARGNVDIVKLLLENGYPRNIFIDCALGNPEIIKQYFLSSNVSLLRKNKMLLIAVIFNKPLCVEELLKNGADFDPLKYASTPLVEAVKRNHLDILKLFWANNRNKVLLKKDILLSIAENHGYKEILYFLQKIAPPVPEKVEQPSSSKRIMGELNSKGLDLEFEDRNGESYINK